MPVIPALVGLRQEEHKFKASLEYIDPVTNTELEL